MLLFSLSTNVFLNLYIIYTIYTRFINKIYTDSSHLYTDSLLTYRRQLLYNVCAVYKENNYNKVLVVTPNQDEDLLLALSQAGFEAITASDSAAGIRMFYECFASAVIMSDDLLPIAGKQLYTRLREISTVPCIVLGHKGDVERMMTIEDGADLYLDRLTNHSILIAHMRSLLRCYLRHR